jgi:hypothetical protein
MYIGRKRLSNLEKNMHILLTLQIPVLPGIEQILFIVTTFSERLPSSANTGRMLPAIAGREERLRQFCFSLLIGGVTEQENINDIKQRVLKDLYQTRLSRCRMIWLLPNPSPLSRHHSFSQPFYICVARWSSLLTGEGERR